MSAPTLATSSTMEIVRGTERAVVWSGAWRCAAGRPGGFPCSTRWCRAPGSRVWLAAAKWRRVGVVVFAVGTGVAISGDDDPDFSEDAAAIREHPLFPQRGAGEDEDGEEIGIPSLDIDIDHGARA